MKKLFTLITALLASFSLWAAVTYHSVTANIANTDYETFYLYKNSSNDANVIGKGYSSSTLSFSTANTSWVEGNCVGKDNSGDPGDFSSQGFYETAAGDLKFNGTSSVLTFHVTNCIGVAILGKGNGSTKPLQLSVKESGSSSEVGTIAQNASNTVAVTAYGTALSASKNYDITISSVSGGNSYAYQIRFTAAPSTPSITAFSVAGVDATIDQDLKTITATVPNDTEGWPNLTPSVTIGGSATGYTPTGAQDFSAGAINYTVTDGTNNVIYAVTITRAEACENPEITTDLSTDEVIYLKNAIASPLTISATGKNLTYQWYSNTTNSAEGATSLGTSAQTESYTPSTADLGTVYYFCVVSSGICTTTSAIAPITVKMPRTTGWVIYDGMTDESFASGSIEYNSVTVNYTVVGNSMLSASDLANRNKNNDFNDYTYPNAVKIEKHNPEAETPVNAYVSFTIPSGYQATKIILAVGVAGGGRDIVLAKSAVTTVESTDVIKHFEQGGKSDRIYDATYTPASAIAAGTYYILTPVGGTWNIFHLQLLLEPASATALDNTNAKANAVKTLKNGVLIIEKNGKKYNVIGSEIR